jgi:hypothetical protein
MSQKLRKLLADAKYAGIYHLPQHDLKALKQATNALGFAWLQADLGEQRDIPGILERMGGELKFPAWYGANYDALADCLSDLSWHDAPGYVLLLKGADELHAHDISAFETLNEVLGGVIDGWQRDGTPFWVFYDMRPNGLASLPTLAST